LIKFGQVTIKKRKKCKIAMLAQRPTIFVAAAVTLPPNDERDFLFGIFF